MDQEEYGRLSVIYQHLDYWKTRDPEYLDKIGFISYLRNCDLGCYPVNDKGKWLKLRREARQKKCTIPEILFDHWSNLADKQVSVSMDPDRPQHAKIDIVPLEKKRELEEITERLKKADPARKKG